MSVTLLLAPPAAAQLPAPGVPAGVIRGSVEGGFGSATEYLVDGTREPWFSGLTSVALGADGFPELGAADERLASLVGNPAFRVSLGQFAPLGYAERGTLRLGLDLGISNRLTAYAALPLVRTRVRLQGGLDPGTANAGFNPSHPVYGTAGGRDATLAYLTGLDAALTTLATRIAAGDYDGDPTLRALADATLDQGNAYGNGLVVALFDPATAAPFAPTATSSAGETILETAADLQDVLVNQLSIAAAGGAPVLPTDVATRADLDRYISSLNGPIAAQDPSIPSTVFQAGDAEVGLVYTILDAWDHTERHGGTRLAARGTMRLPTAGSPAPNDLIALPPGDGQFDLEGELLADLGLGAIGARVGLRYTRQFAHTVERRLAPADVVYPTRDLLQQVETDPGDVVALGIQPFVRIAPGFAVTGVLEWTRRGDDAITPAMEQPGSDLDAIQAGTGGSYLVLGGGISYAGPRTARDRAAPPEAFITVRQVSSSSEIRVPRMLEIRTGARFAFRLWGEPAGTEPGR